MVIAVSGALEKSPEQFVCFKVENNSVREREAVFTAPGGKAALIRQLIGLEIDLLIAGNINSELEMELFEAGISVIKGISGSADAILKEYLNGTLNF